MESSALVSAGDVSPVTGAVTDTASAGELAVPLLSLSVGFAGDAGVLDADEPS